MKELQSKLLSVSEYISLINVHLEAFDEVGVWGEVQSLQRRDHSVFFDLIEEKEGQVNLLHCYWWIAGQKVLPIKEGMLVNVFGQPRIYAPYGKFSLYVQKVIPAGEGELKKAYEILKAALEKEGLFDPGRKRSLPLFPERIALITSADSAAFTDFLKVLKRRWAGVKIFLANVRVQGPEAIPEIVGAFSWFNQNRRRLGLELIVLARGGGSLEELQAFNSEEVVRAIFASQLPVVCGVGHERDITLAGLTADVRAATPSQAAEIIFPHRQEIKKEIQNLVFKIESFLQSRLNQKRQEVEHFLTLGNHFVKDKTSEFSNIWALFQQAFKAWLEVLKKNLSHLEQTLKILNPQAVLKRGYSIVKRKKDGKIVKSSNQVRPKGLVGVKLYQGGFESKVTIITNN